MILCKGSVRVIQFTPALLHILNDLDSFHRIRNDICPENLVITSINDSKHSEHSKHYSNEAIDLRSKSFDSWKKSLFVVEFSKYINLNSTIPFTVLLENLGTENEHFHIQVKKGFTDAGKD